MENLRSVLLATYMALSARAAVESHAPNELKKMVEILNQQISYYENEIECDASLRELKQQCEGLAGLIPAHDAMERFVRYESHLSREIDRTVNRLQRLQQMRRGRPALPTLNVEINS